MNKDLHDIDDLFRSVLEGHEEIPTPGVKESLEAALDKKEESHTRSGRWKRTSLLLLLLLSGFVLNESGILKNGSHRSGEKIADKRMKYPSGDKQIEAYQNNIATDNKNNNGSRSYNSEAIKNSIDSTDMIVTGDDNIPTLPEQRKITVPVTTAINNETGFDRSSLTNKIPGKVPFRGFRGKETPGIQQDPDKNRNSFLKAKDPLPKENANPFQSLKEVSIIKLVAEIENSIKELQDVNDSLLKNSTSKNTKGKKGKFFKPFWMLTAFAAYERAGYFLDSDFPTNITSIKHSEVHEPSFSLGILITRQLKKQWGLQTGLIYSQTDIGISPQKLYALQDPGGNISFKYIISSGYAFIKPGLGAPPAIGDSLITTEGKHRLKFVSVPLVVKYSVDKRKLTFTPGAGIEVNFLTSAKVETEVESPSSPEIIFINKLDGAKTLHLSVVADAELRYKLNNKVSVSFRPAIRFARSPITENNVVETFPRSVGFGMGFSWKF